EKTMTSRGQPVHKIIVFNRKPAKAPTPQVVAFILWDPVAKKEICSAQIQTTQLAPVSPTEAATLPEIMVLNWPDERIKLSLRLVNPVANQAVDAQLFVRQKLPGIPAVDIATGALEALPASIQHAGGVLKK